MAMSLKTAVFLVVAPWSPVDVYKRPCYLQHKGFEDGSDDGVNKELRNAGKISTGIDGTTIQTTTIKR